MKVKYLGTIPIRYHNYDFYPGTVLEVANDLEFNVDFEIIKDEVAVEKPVQKKKLK